MINQIKPPVITGLLFFSPVLFFNTPLILSLLLHIITVTSLLFWSNPIENSYIHKIDSFFARLTIVSFIIYKLLINNKNIVVFFGALLITLLLFCISNYYSEKEWCGFNNLFFHTLAHIFSLITICIAITDKTLLY